ncbi:sugar phosphate nucleotidyltransferase [Streptomyces sp. NPDC102384]|uniref:sugar phosphate nucleotidyltransferase n=1 Tax=Streptomyces sp. NPDC102384 TaxID=3366166 RepID=UPI0037FC647E
MVVLAGGLATRLGPLAHDIPKALQPVGDRVFLDVMLEPVQGCGFRRFHFCLGHLAEEVHRHLADGLTHLEISTSVDQRLCGTGGALTDSLGHLDDPFLLLLGDTYLAIDYSKVFDLLPDDALGLMVATSAECGVTPNVHLSAGRVRAYDKKGIPSGLTDTGVAVLRKSALAAVPQDGGPVDLGVIFQRLINQQQLAGVEITERFYDMGTPERYREFAMRFNQHRTKRDDVHEG